MASPLDAELTEASDKLRYWGERLGLRAHLYLTAGGYVAVIAGDDIAVSLYADTIAWALEDAKEWFMRYDDERAANIRRAIYG